MLQYISTVAVYPVTIGSTRLSKSPRGSISVIAAIIAIKTELTRLPVILYAEKTQR